MRAAGYLGRHYSRGPEPNRQHAGPIWRWPRTTLELHQAFGGIGTWASAWQFDEASTAVTDAIGGITLTSTGTATFRAVGAMDGDASVSHADNANARLVAASGTPYDIDAVTSIAAYVCFRLRTSRSRFILGKMNGASVGWGAPDVSSQMRCDVYDGTTYVSSAVEANFIDGRWHDLLVVVDRTAQVIQAFSDLGTSVAADITAIGSLSNVGLFSEGSLSATCSEHDTAFMAVATAGIPALRASGDAVVRNMRRFTGRA